MDLESATQFRSKASRSRPIRCRWIKDDIEFVASVTDSNTDGNSIKLWGGGKNKGPIVANRVGFDRTKSSCPNQGSEWAWKWRDIRMSLTERP